MKTIEYSPDGEAIADAVAEQRAREFLAGGARLAVVSTDNFVTAAQCLIFEDVHPHDDVEFVFQGQVLKPDADGRFEVWPVGFCDYEMGCLARMFRSKKRK